MKPYAIVSADFVSTGGMDRANYALAEHLLGRGHEVHLISHRIAPELLTHANAVPHLIPKPANSYFLAEPFLDRMGRRWGAQIASRGGQVVTNGGNCLFADVSWLHYVHAAYQPRTVASWGRRVFGACKHRVYLLKERLGVARARLLVANSDRTRRDLVENLGVPDQRVRTIYYGVDGTQFRPATPAERQGTREALTLSQGRPLVAFIGALGDRRKGFDTVFQAWIELCRDPDWDAELVVIGTGAELPAWRERAKQHGMQSRMHFLGFRKDVPAILKACDALVAPTRYEAYGLGVHEALACGLPAFVSASAGVAERYPAELQDLLLPESDDACDLAQRVLAWRQTPEQFAASLARLSQQIRDYSWNDMAVAMVAAMENG